MPKVYEILESLTRLAPLRLKMDFDNVGHLVGRREAEVSRILVALDVTPSVVEEAEERGCQLIVTHHPVIFRAIKSVTDGDPLGAMLSRMIRSDIAAICMHTNLDCAPGGVNDRLAEALGLTETDILETLGDDPELGPWGIGRIGVLEKETAFPDFCAGVKAALGCNGIRFAGSRPVKKVAVGGGRCGEYLKTAVAKGCDAFVTSDLSYNDFLDAIDLGVDVIDAGHYPTENVICQTLLDFLSALDCQVMLSARHREMVEYM